MNAILFILITAIGQSISSNSIVDNDYSGTWSYTVATPEGSYEGALILERFGSSYDGHLVSQGTKYDVSDLEVEENKISLKVTVDGYPVTIKGTFENNILSAIALVEGYELPFEAKRDR